MSDKLDMSIDKKVFCKRLKYLMTNAKETTYTMGERFNLSPPSISRYTRGEMIPKFTTVLAMAQYFDVSPLWLMGKRSAMYDNEPIGEDADNALVPLSVFKQIRYDCSLFANEQSGDTLMLPIATLDQWGSVVAVAINDDSMAPALQKNDVAVVRLGTSLTNGAMVALHVNASDLMIRKVLVEGNRVILQPQNPSFDAAVYHKHKDNLQVIGTVVYRRRISEIYF